MTIIHFPLSRVNHNPVKNAQGAPGTVLPFVREKSLTEIVIESKPFKVVYK